MNKNSSEIEKHAELKKLKSEFSVNEIGKFRFYSGIAIGIGFCFILNALFRLTLKFANLGMYFDDMSLDYEINSYYSILIGFTSFGFAFCYTTYLWMSKPNASFRRKTIRLRMAQINPIWIFFGSFLFLFRMIPFFMGLELTIENDFPISAFMLPIFIFLYCWNLISDVYKSKKPFLISLLIFLTSGFILSGI